MLFFFTSRRRHTRLQGDWSSDVCSSDLAYLERYRDRYWSFHLKDVVKDRSRDTELGTGTVDFRRLLTNIPDIDSKPCYVEEEGVEHPLDNARRNCAFLKTLEF